MLFCIYEVFEAVNTAGLSMKMIRYCFGLKRNPGFWFEHTISRLLAHSFTLDWLEQYVCIRVYTKNDLLFYFTAHWLKA